MAASRLFTSKGSDAQPAIKGSKPQLRPLA
jgi:hypothetical protein